MAQKNAGNMWLVLPRSEIISFLSGKENMVLNTAMTNRESREALMEAYKGAVIKQWEFPNTHDAERYEDKDTHPEDLFEGLLWCLDRGIDVREFRVVIKGEAPKFHLSWLFNMNRRGMLREIVKRCSLKTYDFNHQSHEGFTILMRAVIGGHTDLVKLLCEKEGVDVDRVTYSSRSAVMIAVSRRRHEELRILLEIGACPNHASAYSRQTPLDKARDNRDEESIALLLAHGATTGATKGGIGIYHQ